MTSKSIELNILRNVVEQYLEATQSTIVAVIPSHCDTTGVYGYAESSDGDALREIEQLAANYGTR